MTDRPTSSFREPIHHSDITQKQKQPDLIDVNAFELPPNEVRDLLLSNIDAAPVPDKDLIDAQVNDAEADAHPLVAREMEVLRERLISGDPVERDRARSLLTDLSRFSSSVSSSVGEPPPSIEPQPHLRDPNKLSPLERARNRIRRLLVKADGQTEPASGSLERKPNTNFETFSRNRDSLHAKVKSRDLTTQEKIDLAKIEAGFRRPLDPESPEGRKLDIAISAAIGLLKLERPETDELSRRLVEGLMDPGTREKAYRELDAYLSRKSSSNS